MLKPTVSHYAPWDENPDPLDEVAYCGHRMTAFDVHSPMPTCPGCAALLAERAGDDTPPGDAAPPSTPMSAFGADLFAFGQRLLQACAELERSR